MRQIEPPVCPEVWTLSRWRSEALRDRYLAEAPEKKQAARRPDERSADDKLRLVLEGSALDDAELGAFLRRERIHEAQLQRWRGAALEALDESRAGGAASASRRARELQRELHRKDKALAEAAALLVLHEKVRRPWVDEDDDM
jgi:transposase